MSDETKPNQSLLLDLLDGLDLPLMAIPRLAEVLSLNGGPEMEPEFQLPNPHIADISSEEFDVFEFMRNVDSEARDRLDSDLATMSPEEVEKFRQKMTERVKKSSVRGMKVVLFDDDKAWVYMMPKPMSDVIFGDYKSIPLRPVPDDD